MEIPSAGAVRVSSAPRNTRLVIEAESPRAEQLPGEHSVLAGQLILISTVKKKPWREARAKGENTLMRIPV